MRIPDVEVVPATWVAHHGENTRVFFFVCKHVHCSILLLRYVSVRREH